MRKSTWIMLGILFAGLCGLLFAANAMLQPLARDAELSTTLTRFLSARGDLEPESRVNAIRAPAGQKRLATEGRGLLLDLTPARAVRERDGGLMSLARVAARAATEEVGVSRIQWIEVRLRLPGDPAPEPLRALLSLDLDGNLGLPTPALPARVDAAGRPVLAPEAEKPAGASPSAGGAGPSPSGAPAAPSR